MPRTALTAAALLLCLTGAWAQDAATAADPDVARTDTFTVRRSEVLARLNTQFAPLVLEEIVLAALVELKAIELGVPLPSESSVRAEYEAELFNLAALQGYRGQASLDELAKVAGFERYFEEHGLTSDAALRRIRTRLTADAILSRQLTVTDEELEEGLRWIRPQLLATGQRSVAVYTFASLEEAKAQLAELQKPDFVVPADRVITYQTPDPESGRRQTMAELAFSITAEGECAGPVEIGGRFVIMKLIQDYPAGAIQGAERMTPEQLQAAEAMREESIRRTARNMLLVRKVRAERDAWLAQLRAGADVEILWSPPAQ